MARVVFALLLAPLASAVESGSGYELVGNGNCVDAEGQQFEHWYASSLDSLSFTEDASSCSCQRSKCPECEQVCSQRSKCLGYSLYCFPMGERCIVGASVLFSKGTRPAASAPEHFSTKAYYGAATAGARYPGTGTIAGVDSENWGSQTGGRKCFRRL